MKLVPIAPFCLREFVGHLNPGREGPSTSHYKFQDRRRATKILSLLSVANTHNRKTENLSISTLNS
jgi:hypothetical protein